MPVIHFLNVRNGDCSLIEHSSGRVTMIDANNARERDEAEEETLLKEATARAIAASGRGNFWQKEFPENPISYMADRKIGSLFRFVLTHPDMDHMDGIKAIFDKFEPPNFWDTANTCDKDADEWDNCPYDEEDWKFYKRLRAGETSHRRLVYHSGEPTKDFWKDDGLYVLAPSPALVSSANEAEEWNDASYVLRYKSHGFKVIFGGDSHDDTWEHILDEHEDLVKDIDLLVAPHHGRDSDRDYEFLDVLKPRLTLFGNAPSKHLGYAAWSKRNLPVITNNQGGTIVVDLDVDEDKGHVYVKNEEFARKANPFTFETDGLWFYGTLRP